MPHLVILYTPNLDQSVSDQGGVDMGALCRDALRCHARGAR